MMGNQPGKHWRRKTAAGPYTREDEAVDKPSLLQGNPTSHKLIRRRIDHAFASAQRKANPDQKSDRITNVARKYRS